MRSEPGVVGCMGLWDLWIKGQGVKASWNITKQWNHAHTLGFMLSSLTLSVNSRVQSKASILCLDAHDQRKREVSRSVKDRFNLEPSWSTIKIFGWMLGWYHKVAQNPGKASFPQKSGNPSETLFWKCIVEKSHLQVLFQDVVQQLTLKKIAKNHHQPRTSMAPPVGTFCVKTSSFNWINSSDLH